MLTRRQTASALAAAMTLASITAHAAESPAGSRGVAVQASDQVHCYGINTCKGHADCATANNECKGQNECSGQGFKALGAGECMTLGGTIADLG